ncbi:MAG: hypothetical protein EOP85_23035 [Verrucomicrobiaceae bacterium]|nr:MAG: hypothetical protein EOP85_23035 [Verrucomicrobiaceae bacterium]
MSSICCIYRCGQPVKGRSNKCGAHRTALRRHGHPEQSSLTVAELEPYRSTILRIWRHSEDSAFWKTLRDRWDRQLRRAAALVSDWQRGMAVNLNQRKAAEELLKLDRNVAFQELAVMALAVYVLEMDQRHRFRDHRAFRFQLVRRARALDDLSAYKVWNQKRRAWHRVYKDFTPEAVVILSDHLGEIFAEGAFLLHDHRKVGQARIAGEAQAMSEAVKGLP